MNSKLTVCIFAYNLERFISRAIESVLMQKTNFIFNVLIGEDCSTDRTREICISYAEKYPEQINVLLRDKNVGQIINVFDTIKNAKAEYIAILDADDYWIDPLKLQKQVDFLELNKDYSLCCHNSLIVYDDYDNGPSLFNSFHQTDIITIDNIIEKWSMATGSMLFRRECLEFPAWVIEAFNFDLAIQIILARNGKVKYLKDIMSVYSKTKDSNSYNPNYPIDYIFNRQIKLLEIVNSHYNGEYELQINKKINQIKSEIISMKIRKKFPFLKYFIYLKNILIKN